MKKQRPLCLADVAFDWDAQLAHVLLEFRWICNTVWAERAKEENQKRGFGPKIKFSQAGMHKAQLKP